MDSENKFMNILLEEDEFAKHIHMGNVDIILFDLYIF